jgi:hypothetical protein
MTQKAQGPTGWAALVRREILLVTCVGLLATLCIAREPRAEHAADAHADAARERLVRLFQAAVRDTDRELAALKTRLAKSREELRQLAQETRFVRPSPDPKSEPRAVQKAKYRPPREEFEIRRRPLLLICEEDAVSFLDVSGFEQRVRSGALAEKKDSFTIDQPESDFRIFCVTEGSPSSKKFTFTLQPIRKPGRPGESWQEARKPGSRFRKLLALHDRDEYYLSFQVRPDSYGVFRSVRALGWDENFDVGWKPLEAGQPLVFGPSNMPGIVDR